jgi:hypothetical protein
MKVFHYGLALSLIAALMNPLSATADDKERRSKSFDVCVDPTVNFRLDDVDGSGGLSAGDGINAVGIIVPGGTIPAGGVASCDSIASKRIGTFFANGRVVLGLPAAAPDDLAYVDWEFRIDGKGAIDTTGPVKTVAEYPQTITGSTGGVGPSKGEALTQVLDKAGFQIRLIVNNSGQGK